MNIFKKFYSRAYQFAFKCMLPILPYREPEILKSNEEIVFLLKQKNIESVLLVTDKGIRNLGLTKALEEAIVKAEINLSVYDGTVPNQNEGRVEGKEEIAFAYCHSNHCGNG